MKNQKFRTRLDWNLDIAVILKNHPVPAVKAIAPQFEELAKAYPQQRAGQIICNYICGDYRDGEGAVSPQTHEILNELFPGNPDPFFEESGVTFKRLSA